MRGWREALVLLTLAGPSFAFDALTPNLTCSGHGMNTWTLTISQETATLSAPNPKTYDVTSVETEINNMGWPRAYTLVAQEALSTAMVIIDATPHKGHRFRSYVVTRQGDGIVMLYGYCS